MVLVQWRQRQEGSSGFRPFRTIETYVNPNAYCPVCGAQVYFYQSPYGGRVFFDDLGWPWPKHPCTDKRPAQTGTVRRPKKSLGRPMSLRDASGTQLDVYEIDDMPRQIEGWTIKFRRIRDRAVFKVVLSDEQMKAARLVWDDFHDAPSFVIAPSVPDHPTRRIQFISGRLKRIVTIELPKA